MKKRLSLFIVALALAALLPSCKQDHIKTLVITGQADHNWMVSSEAVRKILDETGLFSVKVMLTPPAGEEMSGFSPDFSKYKLVVVDYGDEAWPEKTTTDLMDFVNRGGGLVLFKPGNYPDMPSPDSVWATERKAFEVRMQDKEHPVTKGLPVRWMHPSDVIVQGLKLTGEDVTVLAAVSPESGSPGGRRSVPVLTARNYGQGRIFVTMLGTPDEEASPAMHCAGFIVTLQRGAEWAATGSVTMEAPFDFPTAADVVLRPAFREITFDEAFEDLADYSIEKSTMSYTWLQHQIRKASDDESKLLKLEKEMTGILKSKTSTIEAKKLILKELSWMGTEYSIPAVRALSGVPELKDEVDFALERLQISN